jgi:hypothetical protein
MVWRVGFAKGCSLSHLRGAVAQRKLDLSSLQGRSEIGSGGLPPLWRGPATEEVALEADR